MGGDVKSQESDSMMKAEWIWKNEKRVLRRDTYLRCLWNRLAKYLDLKVAVSGVKLFDLSVLALLDFIACAARWRAIEAGFKIVGTTYSDRHCFL